MPHTISRYHDFSAGHRVVGHESKCAFLHGHNYRFTFFVKAEQPPKFVPGADIHFTPQPELDSVGRVVDFSCLKVLGQWLEDHWDHKMLLWNQDHETLRVLYHGTTAVSASVVEVPFNPTAENMAEYFTISVAPELLKPYGVVLYMCKVEETRKCSASFSL